MFSFYDVKHLKKAFDYFLFLDAYKDTTTINTHIADKNYCEYIKDAKVVYSSYLSDCGGPINKKCEEFMKYIAPYKKTDDSQVVKGPGHKLHLDRIEEGGPVVQVARTMATTETEQKTAGSKLGPPQEKEPESMLKSGTAKELPPPGPNLDVQKEDYGAHGYLSSGLHEVEGDRVNSHLGTSSEGNGSHIKTITSASMVGVPSIIFLLYKFTPIRTWIDPRIRKTKNVLRKGVNESNELQSNDYNFDHADMDINRYNIAYQSR
ncbi:Plasmodium vivax Vir protein, putative [Plasmodium vivax]|uniref:Vir protein, putative n=1 Tax=Plasmodium vivax TaxID=5855 RepID=A0A1G4EAV4_PLAVI|nr:Plasmodium vivax Vir protein, putative [Plasmodium vivax]